MPRSKTLPLGDFDPLEGLLFLTQVEGYTRRGGPRAVVQKGHHDSSPYVLSSSTCSPCGIVVGHGRRTLIALHVCVLHQKWRE